MGRSSSGPREGSPHARRGGGGSSSSSSNSRSSRVVPAAGTNETGDHGRRTGTNLSSCCVLGRNEGEYKGTRGQISSLGEVEHRRVRVEQRARLGSLWWRAMSTDGGSSREGWHLTLLRVETCVVARMQRCSQCWFAACRSPIDQSGATCCLSSAQ
ncbi:hypothetical protein GQ53DRAFT_199919 [Thozetella sp. PMI_491]|nr:hypothetical protein GQ53DRAFT_199919 [Thozetella sp. PMI_491]